MAISTSNINKDSVYSSLKKSHLARSANKVKPAGQFLLTGTKAVVAASYDVAGDRIELFEAPDNCYLWLGNIESDKDFDTGGTAGTFDLIAYDSTGTAATVTGATAQLMTNQPASDTITVVSGSASDTTQTVTIIGTTVSTDTVVVETVTLTGTTPVNTVKTNWGIVLAVKKSAATAGTVTVKETSGGLTITAGLTASVLSIGVSTVTSTDFGLRLVDLVAGAAATTSIGLKGTDAAGDTIYDAQALNGTTKVESNKVFDTVTEIYYGDILNTVVVTVTPTEQLLLSASTVFNSLYPTGMNFNGSAVPGSGLGMDISQKTMCLRISVAPTTANTGTVTFTYKFLVYVGSPVTLA